MNNPISTGPQSSDGEGFLEPHSQTEDSPSSRAILEGQVRECFGRVVYTHKTHEKCADILLDTWHRVKLAQIWLSGLTSTGFVAAICGAGYVATISGVVVSVALFAVNSMSKNAEYGQMAQKHRETAAKLWYIREWYLNLLVDIVMNERPIESLQTERDEILKSLMPVYESAPSTNSKGYLMAQDALKNKEDLTFSDEEIDAFLPRELKRSLRRRQVPAAVLSNNASTTENVSDPQEKTAS